MGGWRAGEPPGWKGGSPLRWLYPVVPSVVKIQRSLVVTAPHYDCTLEKLSISSAGLTVAVPSLPTAIPLA